MAKLVEKIPAFLVPVVQTLVATALTALMAWLYAQGLVTEVKEEIKAQKELRLQVQEQLNAWGK